MNNLPFAEVIISSLVIFLFFSGEAVAVNAGAVAVEAMRETQVMSHTRLLLKHRCMLPKAKTDLWICAEFS